MAAIGSRLYEWAPEAARRRWARSKARRLDDAYTRFIANDDSEPARRQSGSPRSDSRPGRVVFIADVFWEAEHLLPELAEFESCLGGLLEVDPMVACTEEAEFVLR